jgi:hypothetical protein
MALSLVSNFLMATKPGITCHSFRYDTPVLMADGTRKRISEVEIGDRVLTTDPDTGELVVREVTELHVNRDSDMANVTVRNENGRVSTIHTTQTHQFWSQAEFGWVASKFVQKSKFDSSLDEGGIVDLLGQTIKHGAESTYAGNAVFTFRTNYTGTGDTTYRATVLSDGRIQTFHPLG